MFGLALYIREGFKGTKPEIGFINWNYQGVRKAQEFFLRIEIPKSRIKCRFLCIRRRTSWKLRPSGVANWIYP